VPIGLLIFQGDVELLVPDVFLAECNRNRDRIETT
jgi:hypothetical protein